MQEQPNIVLFVTDDHAAWANSCYGDAFVETPNLDYLADQGVVMENAFTPTPVCSPARACLFSGRYASQHGVHDYLGNTPDRDDNKYWMKDELTLQEIFKQHSYQTALIGKWHLGQELIPKTGFDYSFSIGTAYPINHGGPRTFYRGAEPVTCEGPLTRTITNEAVTFLRSRETEKPFFLTIGHYATHSQWRNHPERLVNMYRDKGVSSRDNSVHYPFGIQRNESLDDTRKDPVEALCQYYAAVTQIDESVGTILDELEGQGLLENTIIIYTSDHGLNCGDHGLWGKGNATYPVNMLEQSIRVPMILYSPDRLFNRQRRSQFVNHTDLFQTILDAAGIRCPENCTYPGRSFLSLVTNQGDASTWEDIHFGEYGPVRMVKTNRYKLIEFPDEGKSLLTDLVRDPDEVQNFYHESEYQEIKQELQQRIKAFFSLYTSEKFDGINMISELPEYNVLEAWKE